MDCSILPESQRIFTISQNVSNRLQHYNGIASVPLYPPPPLGDHYRCDEYGDFVLSAGRLESIKRVDLLLRALALTRSRLHGVITGAGPDFSRLAALAQELKLKERVTFTGFVSEEKLLSLYARCRAVFYAPYDEDYGCVTLEAMRSQKPLITTLDAGGVLEFVKDQETGLVAEPEPAALAEALDRLADDAPFCQRLGQRGAEQVKDITWDRVIENLLSTTS